jgi:hypothetical protein
MLPSVIIFKRNLNPVISKWAVWGSMDPPYNISLDPAPNSTTCRQPTPDRLVRDLSPTGKFSILITLQFTITFLVTKIESLPCGRPIPRWLLDRPPVGRRLVWYGGP